MYTFMKTNCTFRFVSAPPFNKVWLYSSSFSFFILWNEDIIDRFKVKEKTKNKIILSESNKKENKIKGKKKNKLKGRRFVEKKRKSVYVVGNKNETWSRQRKRKNQHALLTQRERKN